MSDKSQQPHHHGIFDTLKNLAVEETPDAPSSSASTPTPIAPAPAAPSPFSFSFGGGASAAAAPAPIAPTPTGDTPSLSSFMSSTVASSPEAEDFYQKLLAKTDFDKSDIALTIQKFITPLQALITDRNMLFKAGVASAKAQAGVTEDAILNTFDTMKATLSQAAESFKTKAAAFEAKEITARQNRLAEINSQIATLQAELTQVSSDLSDAQAKDAHTQSGFNSALQRRAAELDTQKAQYAAMLK
jgi:hypothetical protein